ncbi:GGDEF domain-containing protein [Fervidobacterium thailandense]|uniref:GGDEF domain-containing protein n=1 Tax=Fervidobacterium thailandense TaxID=1008305 RepID=A0A1E3G2B5_9BACT|nr:GGDEF domain-containing protein [Fervidobacterium thailandense]ODN29788.1 hypothetical protein A4H02_08780 [Fervidobacterium thailandense]
MSKGEKYIFLSLGFAVTLMLTTMYLLNKFSEPKGLMLDSWTSVVPFYEKVNGPSSKVLRTHFSLPQELRNSEVLALVFQKVIANQVKIYLNGELISQYGSSSGNLWPAPIVVRIPKHLLKDENELSIELFALVNYGISYVPYICNYEDALKATQRQLVLRNNFNLFSIGASLFMTLLMLMIGFVVVGISKRQYLYLSGSAFLMSLGLVQFTYRETSFRDFWYLFYEKMAIVVPVPVLTLIYLYIAERYGRKTSSLRFKLLKIIALLMTLLVLLAPTIRIFHAFSEVSQIYGLFLMILTLWQILYVGAYEFCFAIFFLFLTAIQSIAVLLSRSPGELTLPYGRIVYLLAIGFEAIRHFRSISKRKEELELENYIDSLTGAYNRKYIDLLENSGTLVLMDLDKFKEINDKYGHHKGDEFLAKFADLIRSNIRSEDIFIRLGGDEFCLVLKGKDYREVVDRLYNLVRNHLGLSFSYGVASLDEARDFDEAYRIADEELYRRKRGEV